jgi:hypothetical protein
MSEEVTAAIQTMERARVIIEDDIHLVAELRARIEQQRALIAVALGYIQSGRPDRAALVLSGNANDK